MPQTSSTQPEDQKRREVIAAKLLIEGQPKFHGSKTIHYANGVPKKIVDNIVKEL